MSDLDGMRRALVAQRRARHLNMLETVLLVPVTLVCPPIGIVGFMASRVLWDHRAEKAFRAYVEASSQDVGSPQVNERKST